MLSSLLPTIVALYFFSSTAVRGSPCVTFDAKWNLLAFGLDGKDWNAGLQNTWATGASQRTPASVLTNKLTNSIIWGLRTLICRHCG
jgi:hypothetical protein